MPPARPLPPDSPLRQRVRGASGAELAAIPWLQALDAKDAVRMAGMIQVADADVGELVCKIGRPATYWFAATSRPIQPPPMTIDRKSVV